MKYPANKYAATRDDPIPADVIATAIVIACRAVSADPIAVGAGELDRIAGLENRERVIARARYYAGFALRCLYPDRNRTLLAAYVGVKRNSAGSFFSALDQRLQGGLSWWSQQTVDLIVAAGAEAALVTRPKPSPPLPLKIGPLPAPKPEQRKEVRVAGETERIIVRNGVTLDLLDRIVLHRGGAVALPDDGVRLVAMLARVMPAFLPTDRLADKVFGQKSDSQILLKGLVDRLNPDLRRAKLEVRSIPKMGYMMADLGA